MGNVTIDTASSKWIYHMVKHSDLIQTIHVLRWCTAPCQRRIRGNMRLSHAPRPSNKDGSVHGQWMNF